MHKNIRDQIKEAMKAKDAVRLTVLRGLLAAFTNELVAKMRKPQDELTDEEAIAVIRRAVKQRKDSIEQFNKGGRADLVANEEAELAILETFLPSLMSKDEIKKIVEAKIKEMGAVDKSKIGQLVGSLMKDLKGKADGADVKSAVEDILK